MTVHDRLRYSIEGAKGVSLALSGDEEQALRLSLVNHILEGTRAFFSKPLKQSDVERKLVVTVEPSVAPDEGPTRYTFQWSALHVNTQTFTCCFTLEKKEAIEITPLIDLQEEDIGLEDIDDLELDALPFASAATLSMEDAREAEKERVKSARIRAARYLLKSEQLYKRYVEKWGEPESDWESSDGSDSESSEE